MKDKLKGYLLVGLSAIMILSMGCAQRTIKSLWRDRDMAIDGDQTDWQDDLTTPKLQNFSLGVMNDESHLFITLGIHDQSLARKFLMLGFTIWVDPQGSKEKIYGIKYQSRAPGRDRNNSRTAGRPRGNSPGSRGQLRNLSDPPQWVDIVGPDNMVIDRISVDESYRLQVATAISPDGYFVYELRILLTEIMNISTTHRDALDAATLGIGIETQQLDRAALAPQQSGGRSQGGRPSGGRGGGRRGQSGGGSGGRRSGAGGGSQMLEKFEYWSKFELAKATSID